MSAILTTPMDKGDLNGECNRTACKNRPADWHNSSTDAHYCKPCAMKINKLADMPICTAVPRNDRE